MQGNQALEEGQAALEAQDTGLKAHLKALSEEQESFTIAKQKLAEDKETLLNEKLALADAKLAFEEKRPAEQAEFLNEKSSHAREVLADREVLKEDQFKHKVAELTSRNDREQMERDQQRSQEALNDLRSKLDLKAKDQEAQLQPEKNRLGEESRRALEDEKKRLGDKFRQESADEKIRLGDKYLQALEEERKRLQVDGDAEMNRYKLETAAEFERQISQKRQAYTAAQRSLEQEQELWKNRIERLTNSTKALRDALPSAQVVSKVAVGTDVAEGFKGLNTRLDAVVTKSGMKVIKENLITELVSSSEGINEKLSHLEKISQAHVSRLDDLDSQKWPEKFDQVRKNTIESLDDSLTSFYTESCAADGKFKKATFDRMDNSCNATTTAYARVEKTMLDTQALLTGIDDRMSSLELEYVREQDRGDSEPMVLDQACSSVSFTRVAQRLAERLGNIKVAASCGKDRGPIVGKLAHLLSSGGFYQRTLKFLGEGSESTWYCLEMVGAQGHQNVESLALHDDGYCPDYDYSCLQAQIVRELDGTRAIDFRHGFH